MVVGKTCYGSRKTSVRVVGKTSVRLVGKTPVRVGVLCFCVVLSIVSAHVYNVKVKVRPTTDHEGPVREYSYSYSS
jgi:hypothetical protein